MSNIYCIGRNYVSHAKELGNEVPIKPIVFLASTVSLRGFEESEIAFSDEVFHYEAEIVLKIGRDHKLNEVYSNSSIDSIAFGIDLTRRKEQDILKKNGHPWTTAKSFLGSSIVGNFYEIKKFPDLKNIEFEFYVNGELKQKGSSLNMIFSIEEIINYLNTFSPLKKGDLVFTGTPEGVGEIQKSAHFKFNILNISKVEEGII